MKKIFFLILAFLFVVSFSFAQQEKNNRKDFQNFKGKGLGNKNQHRKKMGDILQLTDAQKKQLKEIHQDYQKKMDALDQQQNITIKEYNDRKTALRKELIAKRQTVFTKEQKNRMETMKQLHELKKKEMRIKSFGMMREKLDLSDDQVSQMKTLQEKKRTDLEKIKNDSKLNDQEKRIRMKAIMNEGKDAQKKVLTEDQIEKLKTIKKSRDRREPNEQK